MHCAAVLQALESVLLEYDMSLPGMVVAPPVGNMMLGSAIVTSAHGSSLVGPAGVAAYVHSAIMVDGTGASVGEGGVGWGGGAWGRTVGSMEGSIVTSM